MIPKPEKDRALSKVESDLLRITRAAEELLDSVLAKRLEADDWEDGRGMLGLGSGKTYLAERIRNLRASLKPQKKKAKRCTECRGRGLTVNYHPISREKVVRVCALCRGNRD